MEAKNSPNLVLKKEQAFLPAFSAFTMILMFLSSLL
jgi:hypothetical protein